MDEKIKKNPKYEEVRGHLDTGPTVKKMVVLSDNAVAKRKAEVFYRINHQGLQSLLEFEKNPESIYNMGDDNNEMGRGNHSVHTHQTSKTISTTKTHQQFNIEIGDKTDYLLLDLRPEEDFQQYHISDGR